MNTTHSLADNVNGTMQIEVEAGDYKEKVETILKDYRKKADIPGFRKGHVPMGLVKKQYGNAVLADEINKMLMDNLDKYIRENKLRILGYPMPVEDENLVLDINNMTDLTFRYEIGVAPEFEAEVGEKDKFTYYVIKTDDKVIDKHIEDLTRRYGKFSEVDAATENDLLSGEFVELDEQGEVKSNGISSKSTISIEFVEDDKVKKELTGKKAGDVFTLDPATVSKDDNDLMRMLNMEKSALENLSKSFQFTVDKVYHIDPAELNQDFFDKIYGKDAVKNEEEFRAKVKEELERMFTGYQDQVLYKTVKTELVKKFNPELPNDFLKKYLERTSEDKDAAKIASEYDDYAENLKWSLIEDKIVSANDLAVKNEEILDFTRENLRQQFAQYGQPDVDDKTLDGVAKNVLENEEEYRKVWDDLFYSKMMKFYKDTFKLKNKEVDFDEFVKLATGEAPKKGLMNSITNLFG